MAAKIFGGPRLLLLGRQETGEWMRRLDNADCHIDCFLRFLVCQQLADMSCGVTWVDEVILRSWGESNPERMFFSKSLRIFQATYTFSLVPFSTISSVLDVARYSSMSVAIASSAAVAASMTARRLSPPFKSERASRMNSHSAGGAPWLPVAVTHA